MATGNNFRFIVTEQLAALGVTPAGIVIEPDGHNTAPASIAATHHLPPSQRQMHWFEPYQLNWSSVSLPLRWTGSVGEVQVENPGKQPIVMIEVQTGGYLGEDDIIRYEDIYASEPPWRCCNSVFDLNRLYFSVQ